MATCNQPILRGFVLKRGDVPLIYGKLNGERMMNAGLFQDFQIYSYQFFPMNPIATFNVGSTIRKHPQFNLLFRTLILRILCDWDDLYTVSYSLYLLIYNWWWFWSHLERLLWIPPYRGRWRQTTWWLGIERKHTSIMRSRKSQARRSRPSGWSTKCWTRLNPQKIRETRMKAIWFNMNHFMKEMFGKMSNQQEAIFPVAFPSHSARPPCSSLRPTGVATKAHSVWLCLTFWATPQMV